MVDNPLPELYYLSVISGILKPLIVFIYHSSVRAVYSVFSSMLKKAHQSENRLKLQVTYCHLVIFPAKVSQLFSQYDFRVFAPLNLKCRM